MKLTNRSKVVSNKKMSFAEKMYIPAVVKGMGITIKHMFQKGSTLHYPEEQREFSKIWRGRHVLKRDEEGERDVLHVGFVRWLVLPKRLQ